MTIPFSDITSLSSSAALIAKGLRTYDIDPVPLLEQAGIDASQITDPNVRFPTSRIIRLWQLTTKVTGDPCVGLRVAELFQPSVLHGLGFAWLSSDTLRDALGRLARFYRIINANLDVSVEDTSDTVDLVIQGLEKWPVFAYEGADAAMAVFVRMCRMTAGSTINPVRVVMLRPKPACYEQFNAFFAAPIEYNASEYRLCFDKVIADRLLDTANPELARINDQSVMEYLARFDRASVAMRVRTMIIERLPDGAPNQGAVADALHFSLRSLQRKLKDEETTFKALLEETRRDLAMQYIKGSPRTIGEITYLLGFSEPSNFNRAFRRWTGKTPLEFRETA